MSDDPFAGDVDDLDMDASGVNPDDLGKGGDRVDRDGDYHLEVSDVKARLSWDSTMKVKQADFRPGYGLTFTVLETVPGQSPAGSRHYVDIPLKDKGGASISEGTRNNNFRMGIGLGLLEEVDDGESKHIYLAGTLDTKIPHATWLKAKGKQCMAKIKLEKGGPKPLSPEAIKAGAVAGSAGNYNDRMQIPFNRVYPVDHPMFEGVPKNKEMLVLAGKSSTTTKQTPPPVEKKETVPPADDLSDF